MTECGTQVLHEGSFATGPDFECCLPFGGRLYSEAGVIRYEPPKRPPIDGVYTAVTVENGCIVGVGYASLIVNNYAPYAGTPAGCDTVTQTSTSTVGTNTVLQGGTGISVFGTGTVASPYIISLSGAASSASTDTGELYIQAGNDGVVVSGSGSATDPFVVSHKESGSFDTINGMMFDRYGHLMQYSDATSALGVTDVVAGYGIDTKKDNATKIVTVGLQKAANPINATLNFGKYSVTFDEYNRVHKITENNVGVEGDGIYPNAYVGTASLASGGSAQFSILLAAPAQLRIELDTSSSNTRINADVKVDNKSLPFNVLNPYRAVAISAALYAAGTHTVTILQSAVDGTSTAPLLVTISAVWTI